MMKHKYFLLMIFSSLLFTVAAAQDTNAFTVQQAVDYAKKNSIRVRSALIDVELQRQTNKEITARAYPNISASGTLIHFPNVAVQTFPNFISAATYGVLSQEGVKDGNGNTIVAPADFGFVQAQFGTKYNLTAGVDLQQLLFDGQVFVGLQARKATLDFARKQVEVTEELISVNVQKIYYQLTVAKQQMGSIDANIVRFEKLFADTKEIFKQGFAERLDVDKVNVQLNNIQTEKIKLQNQISAGLAGLKFLMNMPQQDSLLLTDTLSYEMISDDLLDNNYNAADRKEYQLLQTARKLGQYDVKRYKLSYLPTLALFGNYSKNAQRNKFDFFQGQYFTASNIGVRLSVPIFEGFAKKARIDAAQLRLDKTNLNMEQLEQNIAADVKTSIINMTSALATINQQKKNMELAEKVYNTTKFKYEQGLGSNQEIYSAQAELRVAQNSYYASFYDAVIARIDYLKATGKL